MIPTIHVILIVLCLMSIHTNIDLVYHSSMICTCFMLGVFGAILLYCNKRFVLTADVWRIAIIPIIGAVSIIISPDADLYWAHGVRALAQLTYSIVMGYSMYLEISRWPARLIAKVFGWILAILTIAAVAEVHVPLVRALDDTYRTRVYSSDANLGQGLYSVDADDYLGTRDLELAGHIRPTFLTQEPSYVALSLILCLSVWFRTTTMPCATIIYFIVLALGIYSIHSPILIGAIPIFIVSRSFSHKQVILMVAGFILAIAILPLFINRFNDADMSTASRVTLPYMLAWNTILEYPISGVGLGQIETCTDDVTRLAASIGLTFSWMDGDIPITKLAICNVFGIMIVFFGIGLGSLVIYNLIILIMVYGDRQIVYVLVLEFILWNGQGSLVSPRVWTHFWILLATMRSLAARADASVS